MLNERWVQNRKELIVVAQSQLENFTYDVVIARGCDVSSRTTEENERYAKMLCNNVITNISEYLEHHSID